MLIELFKELYGFPRGWGGHGDLLFLWEKKPRIRDYNFEYNQEI